MCSCLLLICACCNCNPASSRLTVCVTRWWVGQDNATLTEPASSQKTAQKRADSHQSGARCVGHVIRYQDANPISSILVGREFLIISETTDARIIVHRIEIASGYSNGVAKSANGKAS